MSWEIKIANSSCKHRSQILYEEAPRSFVKLKNIYLCLIIPDTEPVKSRLCLENNCPKWVESEPEPPPP